MPFRNPPTRLNDSEIVRLQLGDAHLNWTLFWEPIVLALLDQKLSIDDIVKEIRAFRRGESSRHIEAIRTKPVIARTQEFIPKPQPQPTPRKPGGAQYLTDRQIDKLIRTNDIHTLARYYKALRDRK